MGSPYPLHYTLRWPYYYLHPSVKNHSQMIPKPLQFQFIDQPITKSIKLLFCGDIMLTQKDSIPQLHRDVRAIINSADYFIGNCEAPLGTHDLNHEAKYGLIYHMPKQFLTGIMEQLRLTPQQWILSVANNHAGDKGKQAFFEGVQNLQDLGINPVGHYANFDLPYSIIQSHDFKFGIASWTHWMNCEVFNNSAGAGRIEHINRVNWHELKKYHQLDFLIGLPHWEFEFQHFPKHKTRHTAQQLMNKDFNLLVGAHPHTLQPMEYFPQGICAYSLGNFCGLGLAWPVRLVSLLEVNIATEGLHKGSIISYKLHCFAQVNSKDKIDILPLAEIPSHLQNKLLERLGLVFQLE